MVRSCLYQGCMTNTAANPGLSIVADAQQSGQWWDVCLTTIQGISECVFLFFLHWFTVLSVFPRLFQKPLSRLLHSNHSIHLSTWRHRNNPIICLFYPQRPQYDFGVTSCHFYSILTSMRTFLTPIRMSQPEYLPLQREKQCACSQMVKIPIFN